VLTGLKISNIALIDSLDLSFAPGLTVLTGETGAGKSILLDALDAVTGGGQGLRLLRTGCERGWIEAGFSWSETLRQWCTAQQLDLEQEEELLLSRELRLLDGRLSSRSRLNGLVLNKALLAELRPLLLDLTGQGQTQQLGRPGQQRRWLDRFGAEPLLSCLEPVRIAQRQWKQAAVALQQARSQGELLEQQRQQRQQFLSELESAALEDPLERQQLEQEQDRLSHAVRLEQGCQILQGRLQEGAEGAPAVLDHLAACDQELSLMEGLDPSLGELRQRWLNIHQALQQLVRELDRYASGLEADPQHLAALQERIANLKALERRHGLGLAELIERRDQLRLELQDADVASALLQLEAEEQRRRRLRDQALEALSNQRQLAARALEHQLMAALRPMALPALRFAVALEPCSPSEDGAETVQFLFSANHGQAPAPLQEVASGGEMSRFLLALKTCLASAESEVTMLFDEIDAGVSGRVSAAMADLLRQLAGQRQVFCVTHQPVVAAAADQHLRVEKLSVDGATVTRVSQLIDGAARQQELAELAGGDSGEARSFAASLLQRTAA
jgi:DNA repair protein RecN (Recombination protein N)